MSKKKPRPTVGERIRERREQLGYSQNQLAVRAGISRESVRLYENGERRPEAWATVQRLAKALEVGYEFFEEEITLGEVTEDRPRGRPRHE